MLAAFSMTGVLLVIVVMMYLLAGVARKRLGMGAGTVAPDQLRVVGKRTLDRTKALYVVEIGNRYVLVGAAENCVSLVDHITAEEFASMAQPAPAATPPADDPGPQFATVSESFSLLLSRARRTKAPVTNVELVAATATDIPEELAG